MGKKETLLKAVLLRDLLFRKLKSLPPRFLRRLMMIPFAALLLLAQVTVLEDIKVFGVKPDLLLTATIILAFSFDTAWAVFFGAVCGVFKDAFTPYAFAVNTVLFAFWGFLISRLARKITLDYKVVYAMTIFLAVLLSGAVMRLMIMFSNGFIPTATYLRITIFEASYSAATWYVVYKAAKFFLREELT